MKGLKRKNVTMADIAGQLGISKNAVSLALAGKPGVSEELRGRIVALSRELHYSAGPEDGRKPCIAAIVPEYIRDDGSFYSDVFWAIEREARRLGAATITVGLSRDAENRLILPSLPESIDAAGYLAVGIIRREYLRLLMETGRPMVCVDIKDSAVPVTSVGTDNLYGGYIATDYLIKAGHTRIGFAGPVYCAPSVYERWCGYRQALIRGGLPVDPSLAILGSSSGFELLDSRQTLGHYLNGMTDMPTAWFCAGDMIAVSMIRLLAERGLRVPQDISVIGFDDLRISEMISPPLTTIRVDRKAIGKLAVRELLQKGTNHEGHIHIQLPCSLTIRRSVRDIRGETVSDAEQK